MSHSITFHCVYFELSTVPKRETIEGSRSRKFSPVVSRCLIWFKSKKSQKIAINRNKSQQIAKNRLDRLRFFPKWKNRFKRIDSHHRGYLEIVNKFVRKFWPKLFHSTSFHIVAEWCENFRVSSKLSGKLWRVIEQTPRPISLSPPPTSPKDTHTNSHTHTHAHTHTHTHTYI